MHDPSTVAFELRRPWPQKSVLPGRRYFPAIITIWHEDPETDGTDDSCGWAYSKLTKDQKSNLTFLAGCEARSPWFLREAAKQPSSAADAESKMRGAIVLVAAILKVKFSMAEATQMAVEYIHNSTDSIRSHLCFLPGWHTNFPDDSEEHRKRHAEELFTILARGILSRKRRWWQHPRWHFWHWRFQVHPIQAFKRWVWGRCAGCGKRFTWDYCPVSTQWNSKGPQWFRSETSIYHDKCCPPCAGVKDVP